MSDQTSVASDVTAVGPLGDRNAGRKRRARNLLHRVAKSHYTHLATGVLLVITALLELVDGLLVELSMKPESHHALLALGGVLMARSIVDIIEGMEYLDEAGEEQGRGSP